MKKFHEKLRQTCVNCKRDFAYGNLSQHMKSKICRSIKIEPKEKVMDEQPLGSIETSESLTSCHLSLIRPSFVKIVGLETNVNQVFPETTGTKTS